MGTPVSLSIRSMIRLLFEMSEDEDPAGELAMGLKCERVRSLTVNTANVS